MQVRALYSEVYRKLTVRTINVFSLNFCSELVNLFLPYFRLTHECLATCNVVTGHQSVTGKQSETIISSTVGYCRVPLYHLDNGSHEFFCIFMDRPFFNMHPSEFRY